MKSIALALASILAATSAAWAIPAPLTLTHGQLIEIVQRTGRDPHSQPGFVGAHLTLDLRPGIYPYFAAAGDPRGEAFICQPGFENFAGGHVTATILKYEHGEYAHGEDFRDYVTLSDCNALER